MIVINESMPKAGHKTNRNEDRTMRRIGMALVVVAAGAGAGTLPAQTIGDPAAGRRLAEAWCMECHAITPYSAGEPRRGPDFISVARRPSTTALSLNVFLRSSHDNMPNFILARGEADDIVAYILSLKGG